MTSEKCPFWNPPTTKQQFSGISEIIFSNECFSPLLDKPITFEGFISSINSENDFSFNSNNTFPLASIDFFQK